jgi:hypothetical protein
MLEPPGQFGTVNHEFIEKLRKKNKKEKDIGVRAGRTSQTDMDGKHGWRAYIVVKLKPPRGYSALAEVFVREEYAPTLHDSLVRLLERVRVPLSDEYIQRSLEEVESRQSAEELSEKAGKAVLWWKGRDLKLRRWQHIWWG